MFVGMSEGVKTESAVEEPAQMTRWSLVSRAQGSDTASRMAALDSLLETYLPVLAWYLSRHSGLDAHRREDLVQAFVTDKLLRQNIVDKADRSRGRFRSFLLNAFQNYVRDDVRKAQAARRMPAGGQVPLDEARDTPDDATGMDRHFQRAWAAQVVQLALDAMQQACAAKGSETVWAIFENRMVGPMLRGDAPSPYGELVEQLGLDSPGQASNLLLTAKRMFGRHLRQVVADTVPADGSVEMELAALKKIL
jgi:DNA-directed RNA polymerase specialized sigma24 family protein